MTDKTTTAWTEIESDLLSAGFSPTLAGDTAWYASHCENEDAAHLYRFSHTDTCLDDLDWETARRYWTARANHTANPTAEELRAFAPRPAGHQHTISDFV